MKIEEEISKLSENHKKVSREAKIKGNKFKSKVEKERREVKK